MGIIEKGEEKIKRFIEHPLFDEVFWILVIVSVALASFGLGMEYERKRYLREHPVEVEHNEQLIRAWEEMNEERQQAANFFASQNGSVYYPLGCKAGERVKEENRIFFQTEEEAMRAGYHRSARCS